MIRVKVEVGVSIEVIGSWLSLGLGFYEDNYDLRLTLIDRVASI